MHQNKSTAKIILVGSAIFLTFGCAANQVQQKLDQKLIQEDVSSNVELRTEGKELIDKATGLSDDQRDKLRALSADTRGKIDAINEQSIKLRSIMIKDLLSSNYNEAETELIKTRLSKLEDRRLHVIFGAVDKASTILGRLAADNRAIVHHFFDISEHERSK